MKFKEFRLKILFVTSKDYTKEPNSGRKVIINNYINFFSKNSYEIKIIKMKTHF